MDVLTFKRRFHKRKRRENVVLITGTTSLLILNFCAVDQLLSYFYQVWKDVDGVLTCDPNIHPKAKPVPYLTFDEAAELAYFGAQVCVVIH